MTKSFVEYVKNQPMIFEVFGHYQQHPLHKISTQEGTTSMGQPNNAPTTMCSSSTTSSVVSSGCSPPLAGTGESATFPLLTAPHSGLRQPPRRMMLPPALPISQPVRSSTVLGTEQQQQQQQTSPGDRKAVTPTRTPEGGGVGTLGGGGGTGTGTGSGSGTGGLGRGVVTSTQVHAKHDLLVWFEVLELGKWMLQSCRGTHKKQDTCECCCSSY